MVEIKELFLNNKSEWNKIVKSYSNWDIYYLAEYAESLKIHGDGEPSLVTFFLEEKRLSLVILKNDIAKFNGFSNRLIGNKYFDCETPYGYGGPLTDDFFNEEEQEELWNSYKKYSKNNGIVTQFCRFHPLYSNYNCLKQVTELRYLKDTIFMDTQNMDVIFINMDSKNRNMIRKARKLGVSIEYDKGERLDKFVDVYTKTMIANHATEYYYFSREYYEYLINNFSDNTIFFYAYYEGKIISAAIFFYNDRMMHYHLSGTDSEYRSLASTNLLLYEAAIWASKNHIKQLHLGGGINKDDSLYGFKKQFNKNGQLPFYIGRMIFDKEKYEYLIQKRKEKDANFDVNNSMMIQYRK